MKKTEKFDVTQMSPAQAYNEYVAAAEVAAAAGRKKAAIRDEYLPMVLDNGKSFVIGKNAEGQEFGFEVDVQATFSKKEFEKLCLAEFGKKGADRIAELYKAAKVGESKSFKTF